MEIFSDQTDHHNVVYKASSNKEFIKLEQHARCYPENC